MSKQIAKAVHTDVPKHKDDGKFGEIMPDSPAKRQSEPSYEINEDLRSLFHRSDAKPFQFFDDTEPEGEGLFQWAGSTSRTSFRFHAEDEEDEEEVEDHCSRFTFNPSGSSQGRYFFTADDPRLAEGLKYVTLSEGEVKSSLEEWKKIRPQISADFKKLKKQANRKRKTWEK